MPPRSLAILAATALAACGHQRPHATALDRLDAQAGDTADPAVTNALADQILVDPALTRTSNEASLRAAEAPLTAAVPPAAVLDAGRLTAGDRMPSASGAPARALSQIATTPPASPHHPGAPADLARCAEKLAYSATWATRLPAPLAVYPDARVSEAAGSDAPGCGLRVVSFTTGASRSAVFGWYRARVAKAGWTTAAQSGSGTEAMLAGSAPDGSAYAVIVDARPRGADVDLVLRLPR